MKLNDAAWIDGHLVVDISGLYSISDSQLQLASLQITILPASKELIIEVNLVVSAPEIDVPLCVRLGANLLLESDRLEAMFLGVVSRVEDRTHL